ncbi:stage II sporulation protein P [Brevibacillus fulvus]|uniref:Stage II sporulation protein P n=1 Tax=Brevibacillus fulvus TaxID=1125967 RepID=A0A939BRX3_9BACL|nr:stage II sporulation protein P [Brevibacillus fulvus]MBM7589893.1 stage II sporulation protein P [Brevibacillus fulvus]
MATLIQRQFIFLSFLTAFLFVISGVLTLNGHRLLFTSATVQQVTAKVSSIALLSIMGQEIPALSQSVHPPSARASESLTSYMFHILTGVQPGDWHGVIEQEVPGLLTFESKQGTKQEQAMDLLTIEYPQAVPNTGQAATAEDDQANATDKPKTETIASPPVAKPTTDGKKIVFVYHTHNRESWLSVTKMDQQTESVNDSKVNITLVGQKLAEALNERGIGTEVSTADIYQRLVDAGKRYPLSYAESLKEVQAAVQQNRELHYFFDLHRDSSPRSETTATINGKTYARLKFVIGKGNKNYEQNEKFANELKQLLEQKYPGLTREISSKGENSGDGEYNQSVSPGSLLIEIGGIENVPEECYNTAEAFADVFAEYYWQAERVNAAQPQEAKEG